MIIKFYKFHGAGNDFVLIDNRKLNLSLSETQIAFICHRRFGIGADGLMLLDASKEFDFKMKYFNSNGKEGSMCGNGGRCITAFAQFVGIDSDQFIFNAVDGVHKASINYRKDSEWNVSLQMIDVDSVEENANTFFLDTGSPHHIEFVEDLRNTEVFNNGSRIRYSNQYADRGGVNVNFVSMVDGEIHVRTYERGVENETLACGTGVTAAAIAASIKQGGKQTEFDIQVGGGRLHVSFDKIENKYSNIWLTGPAAFVFSGEIDL